MFGFNGNKNTAPANSAFNRLANQATSLDNAEAKISSAEELLEARKTRAASLKARAQKHHEAHDAFEVELAQLHDIIG